MKIWLLTHSEERKKKSGTGILVKQTLEEECDIIEWSRVAPSETILKLPLGNTVLIYPRKNDGEEDESTPVELETIDNIIILDGTWQQARKMYNQSPYLQGFTHYEIKDETSTYSKRRNQKQTGLCTAEVAIYFLKAKKHTKAGSLEACFTAFNQ